MQLRLGINNCFAVKRWPQPSDWAPIVRDRLGLRLVEHSLDLVALEDERVAQAQAAALAATTREFGLTVHSTFTGLAAYSSNLLLHPDPAARQLALAWFRRVIEFSAAVGARGTGGHVGAFSVADWQDPAQRVARWQGLRQALRDLAADATRARLAFFLVENLAAAREPSTMHMVEELLTEGDDSHVPVRLCLDVGHMCVPGTRGDDRNPYAWLRNLGAVALEVQLQQSDASGDHHWPFTPEHNREGRIDADRVIDALGEGGVETCALILEVIPAFEQDDDEVLKDLVVSVVYWREALARRGVLAG